MPSIYVDNLSSSQHGWCFFLFFSFSFLTRLKLRSIKIQQSTRSPSSCLRNRFWAILSCVVSKLRLRWFVVTIAGKIFVVTKKNSPSRCEVWHSVTCNFLSFLRDQSIWQNLRSQSIFKNLPLSQSLHQRLSYRDQHELFLYGEGLRITNYKLGLWKKTKWLRLRLIYLCSSGRSGDCSTWRPSVWSYPTTRARWSTGLRYVLNKETKVFASSRLTV